MSDDTSASPETASETAPETAPRARRSPATKAKKAAKKVAAAPVVAAADDAVPPVQPQTAEAPAAAPAPVADEPRSRTESAAPVLEFGEGSEIRANEESSDSQEDWPEPDAPATGGSGAQGEGGKRKRRRRKGKGQSGGPQNGQPNGEETHSLAPADAKPADQARPPEHGEPRPRPQQGPPQQPQQQPQRPRIDPDLLSKKAWKIYLAEVSEEGVALIGDNDARELSRRCFKLAEIFVEEQMRRR